MLENEIDLESEPSDDENKIEEEEEEQKKDDWINKKIVVCNSNQCQ